MQPSDKKWVPRIGSGKMAYEGFSIGTSSHSKATVEGCNKKLLVISLIVLIVGLGAGILIGHFAIEKSSSESGKNSDFCRSVTEFLTKWLP